MQKFPSFINFSFFFFLLESYPTKRGEATTLENAFLFTRVFRDNVCGTFK